MPKRGPSPARVCAQVAPVVLKRQASVMAKVPNIQAIFAKHLRYSQERDRWARLGLKFMAEGKVKRAQRAYERAQKYDLLRRALQPDPNR